MSEEREEGLSPLEPDWHWGRVDDGRWMPIAVAQWARGLTYDLETFVQFPGWSESHPMADLEGVEIGPRLSPPQQESEKT
jgi:hypothetical protein